MIPVALHKHMKEFETAWKKLCTEVESLSDEHRMIRFREIRELDLKWYAWDEGERAEAMDFYYGGPKPKPLQKLVKRTSEPTIFPNFETAF